MTSEDHLPEPEHDPLSPEPAEAQTEADPKIEQLHSPETQENTASADETTIEQLTSELAATKDKMLRIAAEAENTKRRALKDRQDAQKYANTSFAKSLLSVADNLRRALEAVPAELLESEPQIKNLIEGIEATERELLKAFEINQIKKIEPGDNEIFNPNFHEVMFETPGTGKPGGTIIEIMEPGYVLNDRLLRPARVGVAKEEESPGGQIDQKV